MFLTILLVGWILIEAFAAVALLVPAFARRFAPAISTAMARTDGLLAVLYIICLIALLRWKRWGFWGLCALAIAGIAIGWAIEPSAERHFSGIYWNAAYLAVIFLMLHIGGKRRAWPHLE